MQTQNSQKPAWRTSSRDVVLARCWYLGFYLVACAGVGSAQKICIPPVRGVPGFTNPQPNWYNSSAGSPDYQPQLTLLRPFDPRWVGAASVDYGTGSVSDAQFLGVSNVEGGITYLYLSWYMKGDPSFTPSQTTLYAGFTPSGSVTGTIIGITLNGFTPTDTDPSNPDMPLPAGAGPTTYSAALSTGTLSATTWTWTPVVPTPSWATANTDVWAYKFAPNQWAVEMRLRVDSTGMNGVNLGSTLSFSMWFAFQPDVEIIGSGGAVIPYTWPMTTIANPTQYVATLDLSTGKPAYPNPSSWATFAISDPTTDSSCQTGIYLPDENIGTQNPVSSSMSLTTTNTFYAQPQNFSTNPVGPNILSATFYIANWGLSVGALIPGVSWKSPTALTSVPDNNPGGIAAYSASPPPQGNITGTWLMTPLETCPFTGNVGVTDDTGTFIPPNPVCASYGPPTQELHQCMMVALNGPGLQFSRASAFRNMDFVGASTFKRTADVSVNGLGAIKPGATHRDVYLFVETLNMPKTTTTAWQTRFNRLVGAPGKRTLATAKVSISSMPYAQIIQTVPVYIVRAYYDTGVTMQLKGGKRKVLQPETSIGYFVIPHNDVAGWVHSLQGATQIGPNWYRISVANDTPSKITTTINPLEKLPKHCFGHLAVFVLLAGVVLVGLATRRRTEGER